MAERIISIKSNFDRCMAICVVEQIEKLDAESGEDILLEITSNGGDVFACIGIIDAMERARSSVSTLVVGKAYSAGAVTLAAGATGKRFAMPNARIMFHEPRGLCYVGAKDKNEVMEYCNDFMTDVVAERLNISVSDFEEMVKRDTYMTPEEAIELGLIDGIVGSHA